MRFAGIEELIVDDGDEVDDEIDVDGEKGPTLEELGRTATHRRRAT